MTRDSELIARLRAEAQKPTSDPDERITTLCRDAANALECRVSTPALTASEIYEFLFTDLKGAVPEALTDAVLERLALHIRSHFISPAASRLEAIGEPVGWQHRIYYEDTKSWSEWRDGERPKYDNEYETRPLYTSPVQTREDGIREALKPFARVARQLDRDYPDYADNISVFFELTHGDFRRIEALLSQPEPKGDNPSRKETGI